MQGIVSPDPAQRGQNLAWIGTAWHEIGGIPPDTYTVIIKEKGQPELKIVRTVKDGEEARWDIDMAAELERHAQSKK